MINTEDTYSWFGRSAAIARNRGDEATAKLHADGFRRCRDIERTQADRQRAQHLYAQAYTEARRI